MGQLLDYEYNLSSAEIRFVENKLYNYIYNKQIVQRLEQAKKDISLESQRHEIGVPYDKNIKKPTENKTVRLVLLEQKAEREKFWVEAIEDVYKHLSVEDKKLVELKYFEGYLSNSEIVKELSISERVFYRRRERIVWRFANRFGLV